VQGANIAKSKLHKAVINCLERLGHRPQLEGQVDTIAVDIVLPGEGLVVEVEGPLHFARNARQRLGHVNLKHRLLNRAGASVVLVSFAEWPGSVTKQEEYLQNLLGTARSKVTGRERGDESLWHGEGVRASRGTGGLHSGHGKTCVRSSATKACKVHGELNAAEQNGCALDGKAGGQRSVHPDANKSTLVRGRFRSDRGGRGSTAQEKVSRALRPRDGRAWEWPRAHQQPCQGQGWAEGSEALCDFVRELQVSPATRRRGKCGESSGLKDAQGLRILGGHGSKKELMALEGSCSMLGDASGGGSLVAPVPVPGDVEVESVTEEKKCAMGGQVACTQDDSAPVCAVVDTTLLEQALPNLAPDDGSIFLGAQEVSNGNAEKLKTGCLQTGGCKDSKSHGVTAVSGRRCQQIIERMAIRQRMLGHTLQEEAGKSMNLAGEGGSRSSGCPTDGMGAGPEVIEERAQRLNLIQFQRGNLSKHELLYKAALRNIRRQKRR
jgi:hypothetical protein